MNRVYQDRFGGQDAPAEQRGNCFQASLATVLQMPLEEAFDCTDIKYDGKDGLWFRDLNKWLEQYRLGCIFLETSKEKPAFVSEILGIHIAECMSKTLYHGERHAVVMQDGDLLHDPNPNAKEQGEMQGIYIFVPLEAYRLVRII